MTYYPDLSPYRYYVSATIILWPKGYGIANTVNIGWLDRAEPFPTGKTSDEFREKLLEYYFQSLLFNHMPGHHTCNLRWCWRRHPRPMQRGERTVYQGTSEIRVVGETVVYAAPTMIYHYVVAHNYRPPDEFIEAVLNGPKPDTDEYWEQLEKLAGLTYSWG